MISNPANTLTESKDSLRPRPPLVDPNSRVTDYAYSPSPYASEDTQETSS